MRTARVGARALRPCSSRPSSDAECGNEAAVLRGKGCVLLNCALTGLDHISTLPTPSLVTGTGPGLGL